MSDELYRLLCELLDIQDLSSESRPHKAARVIMDLDAVVKAEDIRRGNREAATFNAEGER